MAEEKVPNDTRWAVSWAANRNSLIVSTAAATPAQRLAWLEEALQLAHRSGALPAEVSRRVRAPRFNDPAP